jgi:hypothetical protein
MIQALHSIDRDEVVYQGLLVFSIAFTSLRMFMMVHHVAGQAASLISRIGMMLGS